jgi:hypothetical protein
MDDLFRFLLLRPADVAAPKDVKTLTPSFVAKGAPPDMAWPAARAFVEKSGVLLSPDSLSFYAVARVVADAIEPGSMSAKDLAALVKKETGKTVGDVVGDKKFVADETRLADSLVAMKLLSDSLGGDAPGLAKLAQGYDAMRTAASGGDPISVRVLSIGDYGGPQQVNMPQQGGNSAIQAPNPGRDSTVAIRSLDDAINTLNTIPAAGFHVAATNVASRPDMVRIDSRLAALEKTAGDAPPPAAGSLSAPPPITKPWVLSNLTVSALPGAIRQTLFAAGLDLQTQSLPVVISALHTQRAALLMQVQKAQMPMQAAAFKIGNSYGVVASNDYVGAPATAVPTGHGSIRPIGIGDLLLVKEHVLRYEGGDLAHVENVLKSEHLSRDTRRLERTETTVLQETETTKEEQRDTQTTDRFSLKRETTDTINTEFSLKAGVAVDAKYGPMVEVKANVDVATSTSSASSTKTASEFSKDVVARSVSKLVERVLQRRSTTTITEFEEKYSHGFDNTKGAGHISGYYQWIDKVMQAQVYNYGKRLLFDVTVPEPGTNFILTQTKATDQGQSLVKPTPFPLTADQMDDANYTAWGAQYQVTGMEPPPPPVKTVSKAYDGTIAPGPHESSKSDSLAIDDGYRAKYALWQRSHMGWVVDGEHWRAIIGSNWIDAFGPVEYVDMSGEIGSVPFAYEAYQVEMLAATVEIFCERTERAYAAWQLKVHAAITQGYQAKLQEYEQMLAQAKAAAGTVIAGRNPEFNARLVTTELRRQCLALITAQQFDAFGALELSSQGYAQPNLTAAAAQMPYVRFFEQAFEWEHIIYFYYPFFWGWKDAWRNHMLLDDVDPQFGDFLRAGAARVVFPVRPGFEAAVVHYLETGEIWNGGPPPDISSSLYVPIIKEIQEATGAPGSEVPVGDPWLVHLPTTLVRIRPNNDLPEWKKVGEDWQPIN